MRSHPFIRLTSTSLFAVAAAGFASAQTFTDLGPGRATGVSDDGQIVLGSNGQLPGAWLWTQTGGAVGLGSKGGVGISGNGLTVLGAVNNAGNKEVPALWTQASGSFTEIAAGAGWTGCDSSLANPYALSSDGTTIVGLGWQTCSTVPFKWTSATGMIGLPKIFSGSARANGVSGDGLTVGGWETGFFGARVAKAWFPDGTHTHLLIQAVVNPQGNGEAWGISSTGTWIVGHGVEATGAFRWSKSTGVQHLGSLPVLGFPDTGRAISENGLLVVGHSGSVFTGISGFAWTPQGGMVTLADYLTSRGVTVPPGINLAGALDMTPDGTTIVGWTGDNPFNETGFVATVPPPCGYDKYGLNASSANTIDLFGVGSAAIGSNFQVVSGNLGATPLVVLGISLAPGDLPLFGGKVLLDLGSLAFTMNVAASAGIATAVFGLPNDPGLAGQEFFMQSAGPDATKPQGIALSNGLRVVICP